MSPHTLDIGIDRISSLPINLLVCICSYLVNRGIKSLRLTCEHLARNGLVCLNRVFLTASPYNIRVLRAIADHEGFRRDVTEIIWDDARLVDAPKLYRDLVWEFDDAEIDPDGGCPNWFVAVCKENLESVDERKIAGIDRPDHVAGGKQDIAQPLEVCWQLYQNLLQQ